MSRATATVCAPASQSITPIAAMHARYEAAWAADMKIEAAENDLDERDPTGQTLKFRYEDARKKIGAETDTLRVAILYQVPTCWADALILQFHIWGISDLLHGAEARPEAEDKAVLIAIDTLFDFMACELPDIDHEAVGHMFKGGTMLAWNRRRTRTADLED